MTQGFFSFTSDITQTAYKSQSGVLSPSGYKGLSGFHKYWGKKPTETWRFLIEHFTDVNDIVLDPFVGSGLIAKECIDLNRRFIGFDVNPISIELTRLFLELPDYTELNKAIQHLACNKKDIINSMYRTSTGEIVSHFLWEGDTITNTWIKKRNRRVEIKLSKSDLTKFHLTKPYIPKYTQNLRLFDNARINSKCCFSLTDLFSPRALYAIDRIREEIEKYQGSIGRALLLTLSASLGQMSNMVFAVSRRGKAKGGKITHNNIEIGSWIIGYWRPNQRFEINAWNCFENKALKLLKATKEFKGSRESFVIDDLTGFMRNHNASYVAVGDSEKLLDEIPSNSAKVILTDPPHGDRIPYLELSEMWNSVIGLKSKYEDELVISNAQSRGKHTESYNKKLSAIFAKCSRVLSDDGLMAIVFNSRSPEHWGSLDKLEKATTLRYIGCYPMKYSAGSVVQDNRKGALRTDYVLLYGKGPRNGKLSDVLSIFKNVAGWSETYPGNI